ncbi:hypothetical protein SL057_002145 [Flavobacterium psychrophilum]|nr:hypothetical protein [Flavobacterium psychrophilum]
MQLKKEDFIHHEDYQYSIYNRFQKNGLSEDDKNIYDDKGRILTEYSSVFIGQYGMWNVFYKTEYNYENLRTRIIKYKTGYTEDENQKWNVYGEEIENEVIPLNEIEEIQEFLIDENGNLKSSKTTDLKKNLIKERKCSYNENGYKIDDVETINNKIVTVVKTSYIENTINYITNGIYKTYYKFDENKKPIEITVCELKLDCEELYGKINFEFKNDLCVKISSEILTNNFFPNDDFDFCLYYLELIEVNLKTHIKFPYDGYYIRVWYDIFSFEIVFEYYENNDVKQMTLLCQNDLNKFVERQFYIYEYDKSILEYVAGFSINNNEIKHLFSHKFKYYE